MAFFGFYTEGIPFLHPVVIVIFIILFSILVFYIVRKILKLKPIREKGSWEKPRLNAIIFFICSGLTFAVIDILAKIIFSNATGAVKYEIFPGFGLESLFHVDPLLPEHIVVLIFCIWFFLIGPLFYKSHVKIIDTLWIISSAMILFPAIVMTFERLLFGGVHNVLYFEENLGFLCPYCGLKYESYVWCPADIFLSWGLIFVLLLYGISFVIKKKGLSLGSF